MNQATQCRDARICVLVHSDEVVICANTEGFKALGERMVWLAESNPEEAFHLHLLWTFESDKSRFDGVRPRNVWILRTPEGLVAHSHPPEGALPVPFEVTFQVASEAVLDELAQSQDRGTIPPKYLKVEAPNAVAR